MDEPDAGPTERIPALPTASSWRFRYARFREFFRTRFWALPTLFLLGGLVLALGLQTPLGALQLRSSPAWQATQASATSVLTVVSTAMLTFVGVVFTITLVALQLASSQLSPRVLRTFVRSTVTKAAFGVFLATFIFALVALTQLPDLAPDAVYVAVVFTLLLVIASLGIFLLYVTRTVNLLQVSRVISAVANETRAAIEANYPDAQEYRLVRAPLLAASPTLAGVATPARRRRLLRVHGVLMAVDRSHLVRLAERHGCVIEMVVRVGDYVPAGTTVFALHGGSTPSELQLRRALQFGRERTLYQDPFYGLRELVDVASQALSPAVNQPTTAIQAIDRLADLLLRVGSVPDQAGAYLDDGGTVRLLLPARSWADLVRLCFTEIVTYGSRSPAVSRRLLAALDQLAARLPAERHGELVAQRAALVAQVTHLLPDGPQRDLALTPDPMGLG